MGNGACRADGTWFENILTEWASHGFLVIANGRPGGFGSTDSDMLIDSIDWAVAENSRVGSKYRGKIDTTKVAVMGQSCGGIETYEVADDPRITTTVLWNSGLLSDSQNYLLTRLRAPIAYFIGGPSDIAYENAMDDWRRLPAGLPAFMGNLDVGHFGTYDQPNGGSQHRGRAGEQAPGLRFPCEVGVVGRWQRLLLASFPGLLAHVLLRGVLRDPVQPRRPVPYVLVGWAGDRGGDGLLDGVLGVVAVSQNPQTDAVHQVPVPHAGLSHGIGTFGGWFVPHAR